MLLLANGGLGKVVTTIGGAFNSFVADITTAPSPSPSQVAIGDAPVLDAPDEPYTNEKTVDLGGHIPAAVVGAADTRIRIYVAIGNGQPGPVLDVPVGTSQRFLIPGIELSPGVNAFTATILGPDGTESDPSAVVRYILDTTKPRIVISSPKNGAVVNNRAVRIVGQTQARSAVTVKNLTTNATVTGAADDKGGFNLVLPIGTGVNQIAVGAVDPAGNAGSVNLAVRRGTGQLRASLTASFYQVRLGKLPEPVTLSVSVTDPDGRPLQGASITFTLAVPSVPAIASSVLTTAADGTATFTTTIPKGATTGQCSVTVIVQTKPFGDTTDRSVITIAK